MKALRMRVLAKLIQAVTQSYDREQAHTHTQNKMHKSQYIDDDFLRSCTLIVAERGCNSYLGEYQVEYKLHKALEVT